MWRIDSFLMQFFIKLFNYGVKANPYTVFVIYDWD